jgi:hypothetical protein
MSLRAVVGRAWGVGDDFRDDQSEVKTVEAVEALKSLTVTSIVVQN